MHEAIRARPENFIWIKALKDCFKIFNPDLCTQILSLGFVCLCKRENELFSLLQYSSLNDVR